MPLLVCCIGLAASAAPPGAWFGRSSAMILAPPGATRLDAAWEKGSGSARLVRIVTPRLEVGASWSARGVFGFGGKLVVVEAIVPLIVAATLGTEGIGVVSTLFFGPVRVDWGRAWGEAACRWATVQLSARPEISMLLGVDAGRRRPEPFAGVRLFPAGHGLWELDLAVWRGGIRLAAAGVSW